MEPVFNVIYYSPNECKFVEYNIIPYLLDTFLKEKSVENISFEEVRQFIKGSSAYMWWARCEYEIILSDWPNQSVSEKWDIYRQIMMNLDLITKIFIEIVNNKYL